MYTERKEMVRDRRNERVVRGKIGIPRNYRKERLSGRFSLEQIAADLPAGSLISGLLQPLIFLRFAWNFTLCSSLPSFLSLFSPPYARSSLSRRSPVYRLLLAPSEKQDAREWQRYVFAPFSSSPSFVSFPVELVPPFFRFPRKGKLDRGGKISRPTWFLTGHGNFV